MNRTTHSSFPLIACITFAIVLACACFVPGRLAIAAQPDGGAAGTSLNAASGTNALATQANDAGPGTTWSLSSDGTLTISPVQGASNPSIGWGWQNHLAASSTSDQAPWYSKRLSIKKVVINSGITTIGSYAFDQCANLDSASIPSSVKLIGEGAFFGCKLSKLTIPSGVQRIGNFAFNGCEFTKVTIPASVTSIGANAFAVYSDRLESVEFKGNAPKYSVEDDMIVTYGGNNPFEHVTATAYYPARNSSWTTDAKNQMTGTDSNKGHFTWLARNPDGSVEKAANPLVAKGKTLKISYAKLKKNTITKTKAQAFSISKAQGKLSFKKKSSTSSKINVSKAGKVTIKKGLKKGTYTLKVKVTAAGNSGYRSGSKTATVKVIVK